MVAGTRTHDNRIETELETQTDSVSQPTATLWMGDQSFISAHSATGTTAKDTRQQGAQRLETYFHTSSIGTWNGYVANTTNKQRTIPAPLNCNHLNKSHSVSEITIQITIRWFSKRAVCICAVL